MPLVWLVLPAVWVGAVASCQGGSLGQGRRPRQQQQAEQAAEGEAENVFHGKGKDSCGEAPE